MAVRFFLPRQIHTQMVEHARAELPNECCGALLGRLPADGLCRIEHVTPLENTLVSPTEYYAAPFRAVREARERQMEIVGFYHSHPTSPPVPSRKDRERNLWGAEVAHFIISLQAAEPEVRAWHLTPDDYREAEWELADG
jgi:proteasome lid subunit RPN8/RPN11